MDVEVKYPRRRVIRSLLRRVADLAFWVLTEFDVVGKENFPADEPLLVVANHFSFIDPVAMIRVTPRPIEFVGGFRLPNAPPIVTWLPKLWGYYPVYRGTGSRYALRAAEATLAQGGVVGIFPEGGSWAQVLRPPRPGAAFMAARSGVRVLPIGFHGLPQVFPKFRNGQRARVTARIGKPFGPFKTHGRGRARRRQLNEIGEKIMQHIAKLIPAEQRGVYSEDPALREAAQAVADYPWADVTEKEFKRG